MKKDKYSVHLKNGKEVKINANDVTDFANMIIFKNAKNEEVAVFMKEEIIGFSETTSTRKEVSAIIRTEKEKIALIVSTAIMCICFQTFWPLLLLLLLIL